MVSTGGRLASGKLHQEKISFNSGRAAHLGEKTEGEGRPVVFEHIRDKAIGGRKKKFFLVLCETSRRARPSGEKLAQGLTGNSVPPARGKESRGEKVGPHL